MQKALHITALRFKGEGLNMCTPCTCLEHLRVVAGAGSRIRFEIKGDGAQIAPILNCEPLRIRFIEFMSRKIKSFVVKRNV
jgi:hypothetical protein